MRKTNKSRPVGQGNGDARAEVAPRTRGTSNKIQVHGLRRQRHGGSMAPIAGQGMRRAIPVDAAMSRGFRFPDSPATPAQEKALDSLFRNYLQRAFMHRFQKLPPETLAEAMKISPRAAYTLAAEVRELPCGPDVEFVMDFLHGMLSHNLAGVLGTRRNKRNKWLVQMVFDYDPLEPSMRQRMSYDDKGYIKDLKRIQENYDSLVWLHAAFRLDYHEWMQRSD